MADGRTPGDGKTSPFGSPAGDGAGSSGGTMNDFTKNPGGGGSGGGSRPRDLTKGQTAAQKPAGQGDRSTMDAAPGGLLPLQDRPAAGAGSLGNGYRPFRVGG